MKATPGQPQLQPRSTQVALSHPRLANQTHLVALALATKPEYNLVISHYFLSVSDSHAWGSSIYSRDSAGQSFLLCPGCMDNLNLGSDLQKKLYGKGFLKGYSNVANTNV